MVRQRVVNNHFYSTLYCDYINTSKGYFVVISVLIVAFHDTAISELDLVRMFHDTAISELDLVRMFFDAAVNVLGTVAIMMGMMIGIQPDASVQAAKRTIVTSTSTVLPKP